MRLWRRLLGAVFFVAAVGLLVWAVASRWDAVRDGLTRLDPWAVVGSLVLAFAGLVAQLLAWRALLAGTGPVPPLAASARMYFVGQLGKYVPGGVWSIAAQAELGRRYAITRTRSAVAAVGALTLMLTTGAVFAVVGLVVWSPGSVARYWWALMVIPLGAVCLAPPVFNRLLEILERVLRRPGAGGRLDGRALAVSVSWNCVLWLLYGLHTELLVNTLHPGSPVRTFALSTGAFALAWVVGVLVVVAPSGAGAREGAMVLALAPALASGDGLLVALVSRLLMVVCDAVAAGVAVLATRRVPVMDDEPACELDEEAPGDPA